MSVKLQKKPNFFIIGAPKCGTTSLANWLAAHPQTYMCPVKEPLYLCSDLSLGRIGRQDEYERLFSGVNERHLAIGEASTAYLFSKEAVPAIEKTYPQSRYIVMLRNPVEMAQSFYRYERESRRECLPTFEEAWRSSPDRRIGRSPSKWCKDPRWHDYQKVCSLGEQLQRVYDRIGKQRVLVIFLEDMQTDPRREYEKVIRFLGLSDDHRQQFPVENKARVRRFSWLIYTIRILGHISRSAKSVLGVPVYKGTGMLGFIDRLNSRPPPPNVLDKHFKAELIEYFRGDVALLSALTGRNLTKWLTSDCAE